MHNSPRHIRSGEWFRFNQSGVAKAGAALLLFFLVLGGTAATSPAGSPTPLKLYSATLPGGVGKVLVYKYCITCHGGELTRKRLEQLRGMKLEEWENLVFAMIDSWGAPIERQETGPISRYLFENYGPHTVSESPPSRAVLEEFLPPGPLQKVILQKCVACHDASVTRRRLESRSGFPPSVWKKIVERMRAYGAALTDDEIEQVSRYLATESGKTGNPNDRMNKDFYAFLPEGKGRDIISATCLSCHGAVELKERIETHPSADEHYWERVASRMKEKWQAPIEENEVGAAIEYLNSHFAK